ncbi:MAG: hypothetical protein Q9169_002949 [Polycauliona sp. 2 TL-2023]
MGESSPHQASGTAKPPMKRTLFMKPDWVQQDNTGSSTDFFRRSNQNYVAIAAEAERKRQRKLARKERERTREDTEAQRTHKQPHPTSDSDSADDSDHSKSGDRSRSQPCQNQLTPPLLAKPISKSKRPSSPTEPTSSPKSLAKRYEAVTTTTTTNGTSALPPSNVIDLEDSDEDPSVHQDDVVEVTAKKPSAPPEDEDDFPPSDDEYAELARKAREKARRKRLEDDTSHPASQKDYLCPAGSISKHTPPLATPDPTVSILITSRIPKTNPLILKRKISQRLKDVRLFWCSRQQFDVDTTGAVFLMWKGKRLFDVTTCRSLGIGVDAQVSSATKGQSDFLGREEEQIHMEAITESIIEDEQRAKRPPRQEADYDESEAHVQAPAVERKEPQVRVILKAKGFDDLKLLVKPTTLISKMVNAFKTDKKIEDSKEVFLSFDGDRLASDIQVADTDMSEMDYIDVYVK